MVMVNKLFKQILASLAEIKQRSDLSEENQEGYCYELNCVLPKFI